MSGWLAGEATARAGSPVRAVVWSGGQATHYLRAGSGAVVLLLMAEHDGPAALAHIASFATDHLVIAPSVPSGVALASWLPNLLDGLGIGSTSVVAERAFISELQQLARDDQALVCGVTELNESERRV